MTITVIGVGGGANNVIRHLAELPFASDDVFLISAKTDLAQPKVQHQRATDIFLGPNATRGLGAGGDVETGRLAAEESYNEISHSLADATKVFIVACLGGGTGSGAAPVIARMATEKGIPVIAVITQPFSFEGAERANKAAAATAQLADVSSSLISISCDSLIKQHGSCSLNEANTRLYNQIGEVINKTITNMR